MDIGKSAQLARAPKAYNVRESVLALRIRGIIRVR
jgi:hypothetical protein